MNVRHSISTRMAVWTTIMFIILFALVLLVIDKREVRTLMEGSRSQALLMAQYMADVNLQPLIRYDKEAIQHNIDSRINSELPYIIFYSRSGEPLAANAEIRAENEVYCCSRLAEDAEAGDRLMETRTIVWKGARQRILEVEMPIFTPGASIRWASVKIGHSLEPVYQEISRLRLVLILIGLGGVVLVVAGSFILARGITRPLKRLVEGTLRISKNDFSQSIEIESGDEVGELARSFNDMTNRLLETREKMNEAGKKLMQAEKLASIGRLSATIAHEIRNPLTSVKLNIQKIAEFPGFTPLEREHIELSMEGIVQIEKFIKDMLAFTRVSELNREDFSIEQVIDESLKMVRHSLEARAIVVRKDLASGLPQVRVDGEKLRQVFLNLLRNAEEAMPLGGGITISVDMPDEEGVRKLRIRIADEGSGIQDKDRENIFEPFFSTKASGFGLGLANARKIVEQHGGTIKVTGAVPKGSVFTIIMPYKGDE